MEPAKLNSGRDPDGGPPGGLSSTAYLTSIPSVSPWPEATRSSGPTKARSGRLPRRVTPATPATAAAKSKGRSGSGSHRSSSTHKSSPHKSSSTHKSSTHK